jgi:hypothetical protein
VAAIQLWHPVRKPFQQLQAAALAVDMRAGFLILPVRAEHHQAEQLILQEVVAAQILRIKVVLAAHPLWEAEAEHPQQVQLAALAARMVAGVLVVGLMLAAQAAQARQA